MRNRIVITMLPALAAGMLLAAPAQAAQPAQSAKAATASAALFTRQVRGSCPPGWVKATVRKTQRVSWRRAGGTVNRKTLRKGSQVCRTAPGTTTSSRGTYSANGTLLALPAGFPAHPTVADIQALGLNRSSKVAAGLRIPQPAQPVTPARLAQKVRPTRVWTETGPVVVGTDYSNGNDLTEVQTVTLVDWEITGGSGALTYYDNFHFPGVPLIVALNSEGSIHVMQPFGSTLDGGRAQTQFISAGIAADYGQGGLPASTTQGWRLPTAKDASGVGTPTGIHANPEFKYFDGSPVDGFVEIDANGQMIGDYTY